MIKQLFLSALFALPVAADAQSTTLAQAITAKDTMAAIKFIEAGAKLNELDSYGSTPLMGACRWAQDTMVSFLLRHGATVNEPRTPKGRSPLIVACAYYAGKSICNMLIEKGANVNATDMEGHTALMLAASNAKLDVVELLLKKGANVNAKDAKGNNALYYANNADVSEYIVKSVKDTKVDKAAVIATIEKAMKK